MKFPLYLLLLAPVACLLAQTPPLAPTPTPTATAAAVPPDKIVLTIGTEKLTAAEFDHFIDMIPEQFREQMRTTGRRQFAENIIKLKVLAQEARRRKIDGTPAFHEQMEMQTEQVLARALMADLDSGKVDQTAAKAYYDQHKAEYERIKARHILVRFKGSPIPLRKDQQELTKEQALAKAQEIRKKLVDGADFAKLAATESDDVTSGKNGGSLGVFSRGRMVAAFEQAAFAMKVGEISEPVESPFGYHIIQVQEKQDTYDQAKDEIEKKLSSDNAQKAMDQIRQQTKVVMDTDYFGPEPPPAKPGDDDDDDDDK